MSRHGRSSKQVRFNLPDDHHDQPPSILRRQTRANIDLDTTLSQPALSRRSSLPAATIMSHSSRLRGLEALHGIREYLKDACNFHGEEYRRALSAPSVDALCKLTAFTEKLQGGTQNRMTRADEKVLHRLLDCSKRHPHEQLNEYQEFTSRHARNAVRAHRKRARREADFHLLQFVSRQLRLPTRALRELSTKQRIEREMQAFKERIMKFYGPLRASGNSSAPQSPAERPLTVPRSPATDPIRWEMLHGRLSGTPQDLFPEEMAEIVLPDSYRPSRRTHPPRTPPQQPLVSPYVGVHQTPPQGYPASPYVYPGMPAGGYQHTPPPAPVSMPYNTHVYGQPAYQGQAFGPPPMNLPQGVGTPQQATMPGGPVPGMTIPPARAGPSQPTPQQRPLQHPGQGAGHAAQPGHAKAATPQQTPQQAPLPPGVTLPASQGMQGPLPAGIPPTQGYVLPVPTAIPAIVPIVPQGYGIAQQPYVQGQYVSAGYPQAQQTAQMGQMGQQYHSGRGQATQYGQTYYSRNGGNARQQKG